MPRIVKILIAVAIAIPVLGISAAYCAGGLNRQRIAGNESGALGSLRAILSAQMTYAADCGGYAPALQRLASQGLLPASLGSDPTERTGYVLTLRGGPAVSHATDVEPSCAGAVSSFQVTAVPLEPGSSGARFFRVDESGAIVQATSAMFADATPLR